MSEKTIIELNGDRHLINFCRTKKIKIYNPKGDWNGYGYERMPMVAEATDEEAIAIASEKENYQKIKLKKIKLKKDYVEVWCARLCKLVGISLDEARSIASQKKEYQEKQIEELEDRQSDRYSVHRQKIINSIERSNPLRRIVDVAHAQAILAASHRHQDTDYEDKLVECREEASWGIIDYSEVREEARRRSYE